jgi:hypothetical protein
MNVWVKGVPQTGFTFRRDPDGRPMMISQFLPAGSGYVPTTLNAVWPGVRQALVAQSPEASQPLLEATLPTELSRTLSGDLLLLNVSTFNADPVTDARQVDPLRPTINNTFELGYKGAVRNKLFVSADLYHTRWGYPFNRT